MARHGENIRKRKDGRWEGRYLVFCEEKGRQIYRSVYGRSYEEVKNRLTTQKNLIKNSEQEKVGKTRAQTLSVQEPFVFSDMAKEWLVQVKNKRKLSTYVKYEQIYRKYLEIAFQNFTLSEMTDRLIKERIPKSVSDSVKRSIYCVLNQIFKFAFRQYAVVVPDIKKPEFNVRNKPVTVLTKREQARLLCVLSHETTIFKTAILLCLYTGLRLGELCALRWSDIDFENGILSVSRTVQRISAPGNRTKTILLETEPKSEHSRREIPLSAAALKLLLRFERNKEYVFGGNKAMEPRTLQYNFKKILDEAGLPDKNFHILRHTFATNCIEKGTDVKSLSEMLGHSNVQITLSRYVHPSMDTKRKYLDVLSAFYGQIRGCAS